MPINSFLYPGPTNSNPYVVENSCRFNDGDSASLTKSVSGTSQTTAGTISFWFKRGVLSTDQRVWINYVDANNYGAIKLQSDNKMEVVVVDGGSVTGKLVTNRLFRDCSAWYHCCVAINSSDGTAGNRMRLYINGTEETSFATDTNPSSGATMEFFTDGTNKIGQMNSDQYFDGYIAEFVMIHGSQLTPNSFGEFDSDSPTIWKPKAIALTFGSKDYYLDFKDSGDLGDDESGQGNDFTENNLAAADQATDTPTNNFATLNPLDVSSVSNNGTTFSEGNLKVTDGSSNYLVATGSMAVTSGKWYFECKIDATASNTASGVAIVDLDGWDRTDGATNSAYGWLYAPDGDKRSNSSSTAYGDTYAANDIIGVAIDMDNTSVYFSKNGTWQNSGDPTSGASKTNAAYTNLTGTITAQVYDGSSSQAHEFSLNFGNPPYANSSDAADENGYGAFEYAPPSGFLALCTKNLGSDGG